MTKYDIGADIPGLSVRVKSDSEILTKLRFIKDNLLYAQVYAYYNLPWIGNDTHQLSCHFHAGNRDTRGVPYENNPSARYYEHDRSIWCFACAEGGDVCWWIRKREGHLHYGETLTFVNDEFGVGLNAQDLAKRIELNRQAQVIAENPRRLILSQLYEDKVNDEFYKLRRLGEAFHPIADRLEPEVFARKSEVDAFTGTFTSYAKALRRWLNWTTELIEQSLKHASSQVRQY